MKSICGSDCCEACPRKTDCGGCQETGGHPFGGVCVAAKCIQDSGFEAYQALKQSLIREIQALGIPGLAVKDLYLLNGFYVNLAYPLPNGETLKLLTDQNIYFGNQVEIPGSNRCYGVVADGKYLLVSEYGPNGSDPEILCYRKR